MYIAKLQFNNISIPVEKKIYYSNVGTPSGIIPYELNKKGYLKEKWCGDGMFYEDLAKLTEPVFLDIELYKINKNVNIRKPN